MGIKISVIIPTFNGATKIGALLASLVRQTQIPEEVIVVIDGSTDNTEEVVRHYEKLFHSFKIIIQNNSGRSITRNRGVAESTGEILVFYDDDMEADTSSVESHFRFHANIHGLLAGNPVELVSPQKTEIQNYKAFLNDGWTKKYSDGLNKLDAQNLFFPAANCSITKNLFLTLQGFDERVQDAEDFDLAMRALEIGLPVYFDKTNVAIHNDLISCTSYIRRLRQYRLAHSKLQQLHQERETSGGSISLSKKLFYSFFSFSIFPWFIDRFNILIVLPRKIRYKYYDIIIYSLTAVYPNVKLW